MVGGGKRGSTVPTRLSSMVAEMRKMALESDTFLRRNTEFEARVPVPVAFLQAAFWGLFGGFLCALAHIRIRYLGQWTAKPLDSTYVLWYLT